MRVVHMVPALNKGGTERLVINLARSQVDLGMEVTIISFSNLNLYLDETEGLNLQTFPGSFIENRFLASPVHNLSTLKDFLLKFKPDVIHSHSYWTDLLVYGLDIYGPTYISHFHLYYEHFKIEPQFSLGFLRSFYDKYKLLHSYWIRRTKFILVSEDISKFYRKNLPKFFHSKFYLIPNAAKIKSPPKQNSLVPGSLKLFSAGRLVEVKNHSFLLDVAMELERRGLQFELNIAGDGPLRMDLEKKIALMKLERKVKLLGNVDSIDDWYNWCDFYLHAALRETFGLTILEAMASGRPCICLKAGGNEDLITDGVEGRILNQEISPEGFVNKLFKLMKDNEVYQKMAFSAYLKSKQFNLENYTLKVMEVYRN